LFIYLDHCLTHSQQSLCRSKSSSALLITASQKLRQLGNIRRNPPRLVFGKQLGCHASLIFGVWLICTIQGPKDFRASMYARHGPQALLRGLPLMATALEYWFGAARRRARERLVR
jgi:hypothetical protein